MSMMQKIQTGLECLPPRVLVCGSEGIGKAQPLDAKVLTPQGFVTMGTLHVGAEVIGADGKAHRVLGVYPQGEQEVFRVMFRDGSTTRCCAGHLWFTQTRNERDMGLSGAVRTLRDIRRTLRYGTHFNHAVPRVQPVQFSALGQRLPIDPWLLGMYLGDGSMDSSVIISKPEADVQNRIAEALDARDTSVCVQGIATRVKARRRTNRPSILKAALDELGLHKLESHEKFVPALYLHASVADRQALLRGLLDSDGYVTSPGAIEYCTTSPRLAADVRFLIRSLGGSARTILKPRPSYNYLGEKRIGRPAYRIFASFPSEIVPVSSEKHLQKWNDPQWKIRHTIRSIEPEGKRPCQCIRIDAPDSLYVTDDFILTHNSTYSAQAPKPIFIQTEDGLGELHCSKFPLAHHLDEVLGALTELLTQPHDYQTVVIDSLDWLERLIWDAVCREFRVSHIEKADGGYSKGYAHALTHWRKVLDLLMKLRMDRGLVVILIAHAKVEKFEDPESVAYDRYSPRLHKHASALVTEWCDAVLFATRKFRTQTEERGFGRERNIAVGLGADGGERILRTAGGPACVAKNRYRLPAEIPLSWSAFVAGLSSQRPQAKE